MEIIDGNQYVWVPVGNIRKTDGTIVDITLGRYTFASDGTETLVQSADNYLEENEINKYLEVSKTRIGVKTSDLNGLNTTALDLKGFIDSVKKNGGYYIARYEASYGTDGKANSKVSNSFSDTTNPTVEGTLWNFITQIDAATASRNLYTTVTTDLVNSYAWDTAIVYIQKCSGATKYSMQDGKSINPALTNTGVNNDKKCNIYDMASNICEWTTEFSNFTDSSISYPCTSRGGLYSYNSDCTSYRFYRSATLSNKNYTFRMVLYM